MPHSTPHPLPGRRIIVVGNCGSGKSYVAKALAHSLQIPYICNDSIFWRPNWVPNSKPQRFEEYDLATRAPAWTFDGNLGSLRSPEDPLLLQRADTLLWLDLPLHIIMPQLLKRTLTRILTRQSLFQNNMETWRGAFLSRDSILLWAIKTHAKRRHQYTAIFADPQWSHLQKIRLHSKKEINAWLSSVPSPSTPHP